MTDNELVESITNYLASVPDQGLCSFIGTEKELQAYAICKFLLSIGIEDINPTEYHIEKVACEHSTLDNGNLLMSARQFLKRFSHDVDKDMHAMCLEAYFKHIGVIDSQEAYDSDLEIIRTNEKCM